MKYLISVVCLFLVACGEKNGPTQPPATVMSPQPSGPSVKAGAIESERVSRAAASVRAAQSAVEATAEGLPKAAATGELKVAAANLPEPGPGDLAAAMDRVNAALSGDLKTANSGWKKAEIEAAKLSTELAQAKLDAERQAKADADKFNRREAEWTASFAKLKADSEAAVLQAKAEAERDMKRLIGYIFFGGAALCVAAGIALLTVLSGLAFVGPKVVLGVFGTAAGLAGTGVLLIRALNSPWIGRGIMATAVIALIAIILAYANHRHSKIE